MKVLLVGNGGREHAIARALVRTSTPEQPVSLVVQAGNPALEQLGRSLTMDPLDPKDVVRRATSEKVDLVVVGPGGPARRGRRGCGSGLRYPRFWPDEGRGPSGGLQVLREADHGGRRRGDRPFLYLHHHGTG